MTLCLSPSRLDTVDAFIMRMPEEIVLVLDATDAAPYGHRRHSCKQNRKSLQKM